MDNTLKYWIIKEKLNKLFQGWISCTLNIKKGKENYMPVGSWDSSVIIFAADYNILRRIEGNDYAFISLNCDNDGEFLYNAYKNGTVKV